LTVRVVIQRVRVRWGHGTPRAAMPDVPHVYELPPVSMGPVVVHDVLADEAVGYEPSVRLFVGAEPARAVGLSVSLADRSVTVARLPTSAAYPVRRRPARLFVLRRGQVGRYRANFRFADGDTPDWIYEGWTIHVAYARPRPDLFQSARPVHDVDERVRLYGGRQRSSTRAARD
jgi:hypothetical protein